MTAVRTGRKTEHGPIPKLASSGRRRLDRQGERRLTALKRWRGDKASALAIDPGVLCPNSALEAAASRDPKSKAELQNLPGLKNWFVREFGGEVIEVKREAGTSHSES